MSPLLSPFRVTSKEVIMGAVIRIPDTDRDTAVIQSAPYLWFIRPCTKHSRVASLTSTRHPITPHRSAIRPTPSTTPRTTTLTTPTTQTHSSSPPPARASGREFSTMVGSHLSSCVSILFSILLIYFTDQVVKIDLICFSFVFMKLFHSFPAGFLCALVNLLPNHE